MSTPGISIIVPVYKAQSYLRRCIDSLLAQTYTNFELILVDDGSPDNSGAICDLYARKDPRVKVFHKDNGGVSSARQYGIEHATGLYTIHADPDDWADPTMLRELYDQATATNADIIFCDYYTHKKGRTCHVSQTPQSLQANELLKQFLRQELHGAMWNKLIRTTLYTRYNITFPREMTRWEDLFVICTLYTHPVTTVHLPRAFYHYDLGTNPHSLVRQKNNKGLLSQMHFVKHFQDTLPQEEYAQELYTIKAVTKELAYNSGTLSAHELRELYSEINAQYIQSANPVNPRQLCLARFLSGRYTLAQSKRIRRLLSLLRPFTKH